jgi:long-chain fatty acid transport protein
MMNMKKTIASLFALLWLASPLWAQIDNLTNLSPEWVRSGTRNASLDGTDIQVYNPAGVSRLDPGFHVTIGNQSSFRSPQHDYVQPDLGAGPTPKSYSQDGADLLTPNLNLSYTSEKWALFAGVNVVAGGGEANYPDGSITTDLMSLQTLFQLNMQSLPYTHTSNAYLKASSYSIASSLGGAYALNDRLSVGAAARYVTGTNKSEAGFTVQDAAGNYPDLPLALKSEDMASGIGWVLGADYRVSEQLNFAVRYESKVNLEYKTEVKQDDFQVLENGSRYHRDLPAVLGFGVEYSVSENTRLRFDFNHYFQQQADWDSTWIGSDVYPTNDLAGDASTFALGADHAFSDKFLWSLGVNYAVFGFKDQSGYFANAGAYEIAPGDNVAFSTGFAYNPVKNIRINAGYTLALYSGQTIASANYASIGMPVNVSTKNTIGIAAIGVDLSF